jgi:Uma2 family endonuclease
LDKWNSLTAKEKDEFLPLCPEFIIEIRSKTDVLKTLQEKMLYWMENGAQQAWLLDPQKTDFLYYNSVDGAIQTIKGWDKTLVGTGIIEGFELDLRQLIV